MATTRQPSLNLTKDVVAGEVFGVRSEQRERGKKQQKEVLQKERSKLTEG